MMTFIKNTNKQKDIPTENQPVNSHNRLKRYKLYTNVYNLYRSTNNTKRRVHFKKYPYVLMVLF